ncbi:MAG: apolipoprotein N-acyltransferase [Ktedonobacteraceae bacterium]
MSKRTVTPTRTLDRLSYLWLAIAAALLVFYAGRWAIPLAAWLAPLFLLRFVRIQHPLPGFLLAWLVRFAIAAVVEQGIIMLSGIGYYVIVLLLTLVTMLPYLADRLIAPRLQGFVATLVFPVTFTMFEYLSSFSPNGTITSIANTQYGDLPLMQVVSVTGIWGITFLLTWFVAVVNWAWERGFTWPRVRGGGLLYASVLAVVLLGGGARLVLFPPDATLVRVAGLSPSQAVVAEFNKQLPPAIGALLASGQATQADRALARSAFSTVDDDLLARSQQEARAGAKIVVWPEVSPAGAFILQEDEPALIQRASTLAKQAGIYLELGLGVFLSDAGKGRPFLKDEAVLLDPTGHGVWTYEKFHLVPFGEQQEVVQGDGKVPLVDTPYGRLATVICFDADFPATMRQAGQAGADLVLVPSDDWQAIDPSHTQVATFRAIENGFSEVREANKGLSMTVDYEGRVLSTSDYFTTDQQVMVAYVPMHGVRTIYAAIGDLFAWLCILGLAALIGLAIMQSRKRQSAATAAVLLERQPTR